MDGDKKTDRSAAVVKVADDAEYAPDKFSVDDF